MRSRNWKLRNFEHLTLNRAHSIHLFMSPWVNHAFPFPVNFLRWKFESLQFVSWFDQVFWRLWICLYFSKCLVYIYYSWKISLLLIRLSLTIYIHPCHNNPSPMSGIPFAFEKSKRWIRCEESFIEDLSHHTFFLNQASFIQYGTVN